MKIRGSYDGASAGASGKGYATMTATKTTNHFTVRNIALPADAKDFTLSFYAIFPADDVILSVSDGSAPGNSPIRAPRLTIRGKR